jgi:hypothetical protein
MPFASIVLTQLMIVGLSAALGAALALLRWQNISAAKYKKRRTSSSPKIPIVWHGK